MNEITEIQGYGVPRSRTSLGFHDLTADAYNTGSKFDTRDLSLRPKSSYVRRHQLSKQMETEKDSASNGSDGFNKSLPQRLVRPKSRLGRTAVPRSEHTIAPMETEVIEDLAVPYIDASVDTFISHREETMKNCANNVYDRFASTRQSKRESKRTKQFCESNTDVLPKQTFETTNLDSSSSCMDTRVEINNNDVHIMSAKADLVNTFRSPHVSCYDSNTVSRKTLIQIKQQKPVPKSQRRLQNSFIRQESTINKQQPTTDHYKKSTRSNTVTSNATTHAEKAEKTQMHLYRNVSNVGRPKNPEPVSSRPIERPDIRPTTSSRRLQKRYIQQSQHFNSVSVRPTSESVILARQKTEKNLFKKQTYNRPYSEKILVSSNIISVSENPAQGEQTLVTSKGGVTQASHVQSGRFRDYDPANRLKNSVQSLYVPGDTTFPRQGHQKNQMSGSKPLTLMKLPPLETSVVAKKNDRGLTLAQRETCV